MQAVRVQKIILLYKQNLYKKRTENTTTQSTYKVTSVQNCKYFIHTVKLGGLILKLHAGNSQHMLPVFAFISGRHTQTNKTSLQGSIAGQQTTSPNSQHYYVTTTK